MKIKILIICLISLSYKGLAQETKASKILDNIQNITINEMDAIKENNTVKGYYTFYRYDRVTLDEALFRLNLLDENLNEIGTKDIQAPNDWLLLSGAYDGKNFCFQFYDPLADTFDLKVFDNQANEVVNNNITVNYRPGNLISQGDLSNFYGTSPYIKVVDGNGFITYTYINKHSKDDQDGRYLISYENGTTKKSWQTEYNPPQRKFGYDLSLLNGNDEMILTFVIGYGNRDSAFYHIVAHNPQNGKQIFEIPTSIEGNHVAAKIATFNGDKIDIVGLTYKNDKDNRPCLDGMGFIEIDKKGKVLNTRFVSFKETLSKFLTPNGHQIQNVSFENFVVTKNNTILAVAESILLMPNNNTDHKNMLLLEFDQNGSVLQSKELPKIDDDRIKYPASPVITTCNEDNSQISFGFRDYGKMDENSKKTSFYIQAKYEDGQINIDKIPIADQDNTYVFPAQPGSVFEVQYDPKKKDLSMKIVKLNN
jgi:uncharacterized protein DUF6770